MIMSSSRFLDDFDSSWPPSGGYLLVLDIFEMAAVLLLWTDPLDMASKLEPFLSSPRQFAHIMSSQGCLALSFSPSVI